MNHHATPSLRSRARARRGSIFVVAMWVLVSLVALVLVMSRWARVESMSAANRVAAVQAATAARAGEQYVLSQVEQAAGDALLVSESPAAAVPVGLAHFWIMRPDREDDGQQDFAVDDEGSKININTAPLAMLQKLPGMPPEVAAAIVDWRDTDEQPSTDGAENEYYQSLQPSYRCKNAPFETVEELLLVKGMTPELLYGMDVNRNGYLDEEEMAAAGVTVAGSEEGGPSPRGLLPFVTVHGVGAPPGTTTATGTATGTGQAPGTGQNPGGGQQGANQQANPGLVNVNTASREVLRCLPGLEDADALALVTVRDEGVDTTTNAWIATAIGAAKAGGINNSIATKSYRYSADIVAASEDGRAYQRVRIVVDAAKSPPAVVYRRDLTALGWPLGAELRAEIRAGALVESGGMTRTVTSSAR